MSESASSVQGSVTPERMTMNGKPVLWRPAKAVLNMDSGFQKKLLCDGPTFSLGDACAYSCSFCYVPDSMKKAAWMPKDRPHESIVMRRQRGLELLYEQLTVKAKGGGRKPKYDNANDHRVIYASPLVDVASNMDLVVETVKACVLILQLTRWHIRLLSKSNLLPKVAGQLINAAKCSKVGFGFTEEDVRKRLIFGVSTGTLDDKLATAFEQGCAKVSKRIESLHWLQDNGFRTFGMICPSLPQRDYVAFADAMFAALRSDRNEHTWAEVLNPRGQNLAHTVAALKSAGFAWEAKALQKVIDDRDAWENYAETTFLAHAWRMAESSVKCPDPRLRFLQYVTVKTRPRWEKYQTEGAVLF